MTIRLHPPRDLARRNLLAVYIAAFFASLGFSFVTPLLPLYILELLDGDLARVAMWVGISLGVSPLLTALTAPWWGAIGDRFGQRAMIQRALVAIGVSIALMAAISHPWQLLGLRAVIGALGGISVACLAAVTASSSRQLLGRNLGFLQSAQTLGMVAGPLTGGSLALAAGMRPTFLISAGLFVLGLALVTWLYQDVAGPARRPVEQSRSESRQDGALSRSPLFWVTLAILFTANFVDGSFFVILPLYLPSLGAPVESLAFWAGLGLSGGALAMAFSAAVSGRLSVRLPTRKLTIGLLLGSAVALLAIVLTTSWWQLLVLRSALGLLAGGLPPLAYAAAADQVPPNRRGAVVGIASSAGLLGWAVSPTLVGFLVAIDPRAVFVVDLLLLASCTVALLTLSRRPSWQVLPVGWRARLAGPSR